MTEEIAAKSLAHANDTYMMIHGAMIDQYKSQNVSIVGKVEDHKGSTFILVCNEGKCYL